MGAKGSSFSARWHKFFCKSSSPASSCPVARVFSKNGRGRRGQLRAAPTWGEREIGKGEKGRRSRTNDVGYGAARLGGRGEARAGSFPCSRTGRGDVAGRCSSPPSCRGGGSFSTRATCAGSCPSRASGGAAMFVKTLVRALTRSIARESPSRARTRPIDAIINAFFV